MRGWFQRRCCGRTRGAALGLPRQRESKFWIGDSVHQTCCGMDLVYALLSGLARGFVSYIDFVRRVADIHSSLYRDLPYNHYKMRRRPREPQAFVKPCLRVCVSRPVAYAVHGQSHWCAAPTVASCKATRQYSSPPPPPSPPFVHGRCRSASTAPASVRVSACGHHLFSQLELLS